MGGRPKGTPKSGGRRVGSKNRLTIATAQALTAAAEQESDRITDAVLRHLQPVDVILRTMRLAVKTNNLPLALSAATAAAPYVHPRLSSVEVQQTSARTIADIPTAELMRLLSSHQRAKFAQSDPDYFGAVDLDAEDEKEPSES